MPDVKPLDQPAVSRRERAGATRLRITKAAYALFCERGYTGTTMTEVAQAAGVAVQTVYFTFHTKSELLSSAYSLAVLGERDPMPPERQPWYAAATSEPDIARALRILAGGVGQIVARAAPLDSVVRLNGRHDPDAAAIWAHHEKLRVEGYRGMVSLLSTKSPLRPGIPAERATELLLFCFGPHAYAGLVVDAGWAYDDWLEWTIAVLLQQLFGVTEPTAPQLP
jgi:AcrR family transcriptional regulator